MSARSCHGAFRERAVLVPAGLAPAALLLAVTEFSAGSGSSANNSSDSQGDRSFITERAGDENKEQKDQSRAENQQNLWFPVLVNGGAQIARDKRIVLALASCRKSPFLKKII